MNHAQPDQVVTDDAGLSSATLRRHARLRTVVAIPPLRCHVYNLAADGGGAVECRRMAVTP
jgi:hypothetical protein